MPTRVSLMYMGVSIRGKRQRRPLRTVFGTEVAIPLVRGFLTRRHETALAPAVGPAESMGHGNLGASRVFAPRATAVRPADASRLGPLGTPRNGTPRVPPVFPAQPPVLSAAIAVFDRTPFPPAVANAQATVHDVLFALFCLANARLAFPLGRRVRLRALPGQESRWYRVPVRVAPFTRGDGRVHLLLLVHGMASPWV